MNKHNLDNRTAPINPKASKAKLLGVAALCSSALAFTACQPAAEDTTNEADTEVTTDNMETHDTTMDHEEHDMDSDTEEQPNTIEMRQAYDASMQSMHDDMMQGILSEDADMAFAKGMLPHHEGAVAMAEVQLKYGKNEEMRKLAQEIIDAQKAEIDLMQNWINEHS